MGAPGELHRFSAKHSHQLTNRTDADGPSKVYLLRIQMTPIIHLGQSLFTGATGEGEKCAVYLSIVRGGLQRHSLTLRGGMDLASPDNMGVNEQEGCVTQFQPTPLHRPVPIQSGPLHPESQYATSCNQKRIVLALAERRITSRDTRQTKGKNRG